MVELFAALVVLGVFLSWLLTFDGRDELLPGTDDFWLVALTPMGVLAAAFVGARGGWREVVGLAMVCWVLIVCFFVHWIATFELGPLTF